MADHNAMLLAWSSPVDEASAEEFHRWYEGTHVPEVRAAVPGIVDVRRYSLNDLTAEGQPATRFLAVYEITTDDLGGAAAALGAAAGRFTPTTTMDHAGEPPVLQWYDAR
jgi:hypothetical protein